MPPDPLQPNPVTPTPDPAPHSRAWLFAALVGLALILVGSASAYAYVTYFAQPDAKALFIRSFLVSTANSVSYAGTTTLQVAQADQHGVVTIGVSGVADRVASTTDTIATVHADGSAAGSSGSLELTLEVRSVQHKLYLELQRFSLALPSVKPNNPAQPYIAMADAFVQPYLNKWVWLSEGTSSLSSVPLYQPPKYSQADVDALRAYVAKGEFIQSATVLGNESIGETPTYHLRVEIQNTQEFVDLIHRFLDEQSQNQSLPSDAALDPMLMQRIEVDEWVGKTDGRLYALKVSPVTFSDPATHTSETVALELHITGYNQPVSVEASQDAVSLESLLQQVMGGLFNNLSKAKQSTARGLK